MYIHILVSYMNNRRVFETTQPQIHLRKPMFLKCCHIYTVSSSQKVTHTLSLSLAFFFSSGVFLTSPLVGTLSLALVTPLSITYSVFIRQVYTIHVHCFHGYIPI